MAFAGLLIAACCFRVMVWPSLLAPIGMLIYAMSLSPAAITKARSVIQETEGAIVRAHELRKYMLIVPSQTYDNMNLTGGDHIEVISARHGDQVFVSFKNPDDLVYFRMKYE